jgi:hypothetical protein
MPSCYLSILFRYASKHRWGLSADVISATAMGYYFQGVQIERSRKSVTNNDGRW